jgi:hypothetical protein
MKRHIETIFCDDIRQEIGGKLSYIGAYFNALYVNELPAVLPKFCVGIKVITPADQPFRSLKVLIKKDDEILAELEPEIGFLDSQQNIINKASHDSRENSVLAAQFIAAFSPLKLDKACTLKVIVNTEDDELRGLGLKIDKHPENLESKIPKHAVSNKKKAKSTRTK